MARANVMTLAHANDAHIAECLALARTLIRAEPSREIWECVEEQAESLTAEPADIAFWTYHVTGTDAAPRFRAMIDHQQRMAEKFHPCNVRTFCCEGGPLDMFERCIAMCAYVHSAAFNAPTVFLDSDAFPNGDLRATFAGIQDFALTVRDEAGLFPINEGVILAQPTEAARAFFRAYLGTFEACRNAREMRKFGSDLGWWWGGQMVLNALGDRATLLPCAVYNFSPEMGLSYDKADFDKALICHLKGPRKGLFDQLVAYQNAR